MRVVGSYYLKSTIMASAKVTAIISLSLQSEQHLLPASSIGKLVMKQPKLFTVHRLPTKENKLSFSVSVCSKQTETAVFRIDIYTENGNIYIFTAVSDGKRKSRLPFAQCTKWKFVVTLFIDEETR